MTRLNAFPLSSVAVVITTALSSSNAVAQAVDDSRIIDEIMVTAQKREQSIADVPVAISAYDGTFLEQLGVAELDVLSDITPGLVIQEQSPNNPGFVIRGITSDSGSAQSAPRVSVYYNGVDVSRSRGSYFELYDIERVEVVKGPQATLFGTASSVGAVSVITRKPEEAMSAEFTLGLGNYNATTLSGFVTGGNREVQGRLALQYRTRDGYIENIAGDEGAVTAGWSQQEDMQGIERLAFRPSLRFTPTDDLTVDLVYSYERNNDTGTSFKNGVYAPTDGDTSPFSYVEMAGSPLSGEVFGKDKLGIERTVNDINATIEYALSDTTTLTSITGFRNFDSLEVFDADGTQAWFLEFGEDAEGEQLSQEFRVVVDTDQYTAIYGVNYFSEEGHQRVPFSTEEVTYLNCLGYVSTGLSCTDYTSLLVSGAQTAVPYYAEYTNFGDNTTLSSFADLTYYVNNNLQLTAGLRYVSEDKESGFSSVSPDGLLSGSPLLPLVSTDGEKFTASGDYSAWLPRFNALYAISPDLNVFATISKGRRSDVIEVNSTIDSAGNVVADVDAIAAEVVWNYEAGLKGQTLNGKVGYAASVYYQDYSDFQVTLQDEAGDFYTANAGAATNIGAEIEVTALITDGFEVLANAAYIDATIDDDADNGDLAGNRFRLQPEWTASVGAFYHTPITANYQLTSSVVHSYRSDVFFETDNAPIAGLAIAEDAVNLTNLRIGIENTTQAWSVNMFVNNLFDTEYLVDAGNTGGSFGNPTFVAGPPRFYGIEFSMHFGAQ